jgi:hypothetical protein
MQGAYGNTGGAYALAAESAMTLQLSFCPLHLSGKPTDSQRMPVSQLMSTRVDVSALTVSSIGWHRG